MLAAVWVLPLTVISTGSCRYFDDSRRIWAGMVAENSATCLSVRGVGEDRLDVLGEPHVEHLVGLVEDQEAQLGEVEGALLEVVHDPAGRADDDVDAAAQGRELDAVPLAAVDGQDLDAGRAGGVLLERLAHLERQLAGGREHERLGRLLRQVEPGEDRQRERRGLAGAGLRQPDHVAAGHQRRDRGRLDRGGCLVAHAGDRAEHGPGEPEVGEGLLVWRGAAHLSTVVPSRVGASIRRRGGLSHPAFASSARPGSSRLCRRP